MSGNDGEVAEVYVEYDDDLEVGEFTLMLTNIQFALANGSMLECLGDDSYAPLLGPMKVKSTITVKDSRVGISSVKSMPHEVFWYDFKGQKIVQPTRGIYIRNGRKEVVK